MSTEIYYFSGTGNSLHVAQALQRQLPDAVLIPIIHCLHSPPIQVKAEIVGFVFPNFCLTLPIPLHDFLLQADLRNAQYLFAVCTRGGTPFKAFNFLNELIKPQHKKLSAQINITMPWNHPVGKENLIGSVTPEKRELLETTMLKQIEAFSQVILRREEYIFPDTGADFKIPAWMDWLFGTLVPHSANYRLHAYMYQDLVRFYVDEKCQGCGRCSSLCPNQRIEMAGLKPVWKKKVSCYACFACINTCPRQAIQIEKRFLVDSHTPENPRYCHPAVSLKDLSNQR
jgi:NAD-dependent dihydropyrimidine dehydrogenase PreA subunit